MNNEEIKEKENTAQTANETANAENDTENTSEANTEVLPRHKIFNCIKLNMCQQLI